jgi:hypothetical protein
VLDATLEVEAFEVIWNVNGEFYAKTEVKFGETVTAPEYTIPEGHIFSGWDVPETMPAENIELDATLEVGKFKVTWNVDGKVTEEAYEYGETIIAPRNPHKAGNRCVSCSSYGERRTASLRNISVNKHSTIYHDLTVHTVCYISAGNASALLCGKGMISVTR